METKDRVGRVEAGGADAGPARSDRTAAEARGGPRAGGDVELLDLGDDDVDPDPKDTAGTDLEPPGESLAFDPDDEG